MDNRIPEKIIDLFRENRRGAILELLVFLKPQTEGKSIIRILEYAMEKVKTEYPEDKEVLNKMEGPHFYKHFCRNYRKLYGYKNNFKGKKKTEGEKNADSVHLVKPETVLTESRTLGVELSPAVAEELASKGHFLNSSDIVSLEQSRKKKKY